MKSGSAFFFAVLAGVVGHQIGKSSERERTAALQREILRIHGLQASRERELSELRKYVAAANVELAQVAGQRREFAGFLEWLSGVHPELVETYRRMKQAEATIVTLESHVDADRRRLAELETRH